MEDTLDEWADALESLASEIRGMARFQRATTPVPDSEIKNLMRDYGDPETQSHPPVRFKHGPEDDKFTRTEVTYHPRDEHLAEQHSRQAFEAHIRVDLGRGLIVGIRYENGEKQVIKPGDAWTLLH